MHEYMVNLAAKINGNFPWAISIIMPIVWGGAKCLKIKHAIYNLLVLINTHVDIIIHTFGTPYITRYISYTGQYCMHGCCPNYQYCTGRLPQTTFSFITARYDVLGVVWQIT